MHYPQTLGILTSYCRKTVFLVASILLCTVLLSCIKKPPAGNGDPKPPGSQVGTTLDKATGKTIYYPTSIYDGANDTYINQTVEDYGKTSSRFCKSRARATENFVIFWEAGYGDNPDNAPEGYRISLAKVMSALESMYAFYRDSLQFVDKGNSLTDKYRMVVYLFYNKDFGTVYGSGVDDKVGVALLYPARIQSEPYGALAHELGHCFQYMVHADGKNGFADGTHWEMTSQFMLFRYYPTWPNFESYHVTSFLDATYLAFTHEDNQYHSPFVLEYWAGKYGQDFIGRLWKSAKPDEDFVSAYKRLNGVTQTAFNDEMLDAYRKFITWDIDRDRAVMSGFSNQHISVLDSIGQGWLRIAAANAPQNYGYNGIQLAVPVANTVVSVSFKGLTSAAGYHIINADKAGWRYGFVCQQANGTRVYSSVSADAGGELSFKVPEQTTYLWLVVMGAPTEHWKHTPDYHNNNHEQWPYEVKFTNTSIVH